MQTHNDLGSIRKTSTHSRSNSICLFLITVKWHVLLILQVQKFSSIVINLIVFNFHYPVYISSNLAGINSQQVLQNELNKKANKCVNP
jgi:hypothetical protein